MEDNKSFEVVKDFGAFGDGKWQKHLTLVKWFGKDPVFDLRVWNEDMTKCGKGITLTKDDLYDLQSIIEDVFEG